MSAGELKYAEPFLFVDDLEIGSSFYKGGYKRSFIFGIVLMFNKVHMQGVGVVLHAIHISGKSMIEEFIDVLSRRSKLGGMMQGVNTLQFSPSG